MLLTILSIVLMILLGGGQPLDGGSWPPWPPWDSSPWGREEFLSTPGSENEQTSAVLGCMKHCHRVQQEQSSPAERSTQSGDRLKPKGSTALIRWKALNKHPGSPVLEATMVTSLSLTPSHFTSGRIYILLKNTVSYLWNLYSISENAMGWVSPFLSSSVDTFHWTKHPMETVFI